MNNKTKIEVGTIEDLKNLVQKSIGNNLTADNIAVVHAQPTPSGKFNVSKSNIVEFFEQVKPLLKEGNVAVVTAEQMSQPEVISNNKNKKRM